MACLFEGATLHKNHGPDADASVLQGKTVGIYFSAGWDGRSRTFTPSLKQFHDELRKRDAPFEVVNVPFDKSEENMMNCLHEEHGDWYCLGFKDAMIRKLKDKYGVDELPELVIVKPNGDLISGDASDEIKSHRKTPAELLEEWNA